MKQVRQLSKKGILPMLAIAILYPLIMGVFHQSYLILLGSYAMLYIIVVSGIDVLFGYSGQITMGHAGFYAIGAYGTAIIHNYLNLPPMLSILLHLVGYVSPDTFVRKQSVMFVTMLLFGGSASVGGTITGVIFVLILTELLRAAGLSDGHLRCADARGDRCAARRPLRRYPAAARPAPQPCRSEKGGPRPC